MATEGIPGELVTDRGKEGGSASLQDACDSLGIRLNIGPPMMPEGGPLVERAFGSANTMFIHGLPGTTFSNPQQRGNYDSQKHACIYLDELEQAWNIFLVDYYAQRPHRGLSGATPASRWKQAVGDGFIPRLPTSAKELRILLGQLTWRTIQHYGIEINGLRYNCRELGPLRHTLQGHGVPQQQLSEIPLKGSPRSTWVKIKSHPSDLSRHTGDAFNHQYIEVPALAQEYTQGRTSGNTRLSAESPLRRSKKPIWPHWDAHRSGYKTS